MNSKYETVIGLEIHAELATESKLFCRCKVGFGAEANTQTCPICLGMPGVLPVLNERALEYTIRAALALNCEIPPYSKFDRKNYFYPDLPKGYQISQLHLPFSQNGYVEFDLERERKKVGITRVHLEEDAGKLVHTGVSNSSNMSYVDFNRSCIPLIEIVGEPDLRSPAEAIAYMRAVKEILEYVGVSHCNMEQGQLRADLNVSLRPRGSSEYGTRTEVKNMNSFRSILAALEYEVERQAQVLDSGGSVEQETLLFDEERGITMSMRNKEEAHDYRYFPEPDLVPFEIDATWVEQLRSDLPELPLQRRERLQREYGLSADDALALAATRQMADYYEACVSLSGQAKECANWVRGDLSALLNETGQTIELCRATPQHLADMLSLIQSGAISGKIAKTVLEKMFHTGRDAKSIVEAEGLTQISDEDQIAAIIDDVIDSHPGPADDVRNGRLKAIGFLVGQVMKATQGKANPRLVNELLRAKLLG